jgi:hypothetical protein
MSRRSKKGKPISDAGVGAPGAGPDGSASVIAPSTNASVTGALRGPFGAPDLIEPPVSGLVASPFGKSYFTKRSRPIPDDVPQVTVETWLFDILGSFSNGVSTGTGNHFSLPDYVFENWFTRYRFALETANKYRATDTSMTDPTIFRWYWNLYHDTVADVVCLMCLGRLRTWSRGMNTLTTYLTDAYLSQIIGIWRRLSAIKAPSALKAMAVMDGLPIQSVTDRGVHVRLWRIDACDLKPSGGAYTVIDEEPYKTLGADSTEMANMLSILGEAIVVLEGTTEAANQSDLTKMLDLINMGSYFSGTKSLFVPGLPVEYSMGPIRADESGWNELFCRAMIGNDTKGLGADQMLCFPPIAHAELNGCIPLTGNGAPGLNEWSLFGSIKAGLLNSTAGADYSAATDEWILYGTNLRVIHSYTKGGGLTTDPFLHDFHTWDEEDGWTTWTLSKDYGDVTGLQDILGGICVLFPSPYYPALLDAQAGGAIDLEAIGNGRPR